MRKLICNFKMNFSLFDILEYKKQLEKNGVIDGLILCPSFCYLPVLHSKNYQIGAQDVSQYDDFAHTGQVSASMLKSLGISCILLNHFECQNSKEEVKAKLQQALKYKIPVYLFVSETLEEHNYQYTVPKVVEQIKYFLEGIDPQYYPLISFVYEPHWLIGSDTSLPEENIKYIFYMLRKKCFFEFHYMFSFLYGGGLTKKDVLSFQDASYIDGIVLGNAAKSVENVIEIAKMLKFDTTRQN